MVYDELAGVHPAVVPHEEGNKSGRGAVGLEVVGALAEAVDIEVTVLRALF